MLPLAGTFLLFQQQGPALPLQHAMLLHQECTWMWNQVPLPVPRNYFCSELLVSAVSLNKKACSQPVYAPLSLAGLLPPRGIARAQQYGDKALLGWVWQNPAAGHHPPQPWLTGDSTGAVLMLWHRVEEKWCIALVPAPSGPTDTHTTQGHCSAMRGLFTE